MGQRSDAETSSWFTRRFLKLPVDNEQWNRQQHHEQSGTFRQLPFCIFKLPSEHGDSGKTDGQAEVQTSGKEQRQHCANDGRVRRSLKVFLETHFLKTTEDRRPETVVRRRSRLQPDLKNLRPHFPSNQ